MSPRALLTSWWKAGTASENFSGAVTPWDWKNSVHGKFGVSASASARLTMLLSRLTSREKSSRDLDTLASRVSNAITSPACLCASAAATPDSSSTLAMWAT